MAGNLDFITTLFFLLMMTMMGFMVVAQLEPKVVQAESKPRIVTIRQDGTGDFKTIMDAVNTIPEGNTQRTILRIAPGFYKEKVFVNRSKPFVTLYGDDPRSNPVISYGATAAQVGTWDSATVAVESDYFMAANIIFENSAPMPKPGAEGGQAVAMRISGDKGAFYNCRFLGYQDTLLDDVGMHYFQDCFIQGMVDFIFGKGRSMYLKCEIHSVANSVTAITAQGRAGIEDNGFVFINCMISGIGNAYLGRAWKDSSRVIMAYTYMSELVNEKGWDNFGHPEYNNKLFYAEYNCTGPGAVTSKRAPYTKLLNDEEVKPFLSKTFINADIWLLPAPKF